MLEKGKAQLLAGHPFHAASALSPNTLFLLGNLLGREGPLCLGGNNTPYIRMLLRSGAAGGAAAGNRVTVHTLASPVQGGWALRKNQADRGLFLEGRGRDYVRVWVLDQWSLPAEEEYLLRLEGQLEENALFKVRDSQIGTLAVTPLTAAQWAKDIVAQAALPHPALRRLTVAVEGPCPANTGLILALQTLGCRVEGQWRKGIPCFSALRGGFALQARDEQGSLISPDQLLTLAVLLEMEQGSGKVTLPPDATAAAVLVAMGHNGRIEYLSGQEEDPARPRYAGQPWLWSAPGAAVRICSRMRTAGQRLDDLLNKIPRFGRHSRDIPFAAGQSRAATLLADRSFTPLPGGGSRMRTESGWLSLFPRAASLRITAEGPDLELAAELCSRYTHRALQLKQALEEGERGKNSISSAEKA